MKYVTYIILRRKLRLIWHIYSQKSMCPNSRPLFRGIFWTIYKFSSLQRNTYIYVKFDKEIEFELIFAWKCKLKKIPSVLYFFFKFLVIYALKNLPKYTKNSYHHKVLGSSYYLRKFLHQSTQKWMNTSNWHEKKLFFGNGVLCPTGGAKKAYK